MEVNKQLRGVLERERERDVIHHTMHGSHNSQVPQADNCALLFMQGLFIFFFHVVRSDKVTTKLRNILIIILWVGDEGSFGLM